MRHVILLLALGTTACSDGVAPLGEDSGVRVSLDGGFQDALVQDSAGDTGVRDATTRDAGVLFEDARTDAGDDAGPPVDLDAVDSLSMGLQHACAIRAESREIVCWGSNENEECSRAPAGRATKVTVSAGFSCGLFEDGDVRCWGATLGSPPDLDAANPSVDLAAGAEHVCVRRADGGIFCWGDPTYRSPPAGSFDALASGGRNSCAIRSEDHEVVCWRENRPEWEPFDGIAMSAVATDSYITCAIRESDQKLICTGDDAIVASAPRDGRFIAVSAGNGTQWSFCAIREDGVTFCGGRDWQASYTPDVPMREVSVGRHSVCGITLEGDTRCWGDGRWALLSGYPRSTEFHGVAAQYAGMCAMDGLDRLWCFTDGFPTRTLLANPERPHGDTPIRSVAVGNGGAIAAIRRDDGALLYGGTIHEPFDAVTFWRGMTAIGIRSSDHSALFIDSASTRYDGAALRNLSSSCGLFEADAHVECAYTSSPPPAVEFRSLARGILGCGIREHDQRAMCWDGPSGAPDVTVETMVTYSIGLRDDVACAIRAEDSVVVCWGGEIALPAEPMREISETTCGIRASDGTLTCWGRYSWNPR